jgi:hypothetical protein
MVEINSVREKPGMLPPLIRFLEVHLSLHFSRRVILKTRDAIPLRTASRVAQVVAETASITLEDGSQFHGFRGSCGYSFQVAVEINSVREKPGMLPPLIRFLEVEMNLKEANKRWQHPWLLAHRVDLHRNLKRIATTATCCLGDDLSNTGSCSKRDCIAGFRGSCGYSFQVAVD